MQPSAYDQNLVPGLRTAVPSVPHGLVDLDEVAVCAAVVMDDEGHHGATYELGGPLVTLREGAGMEVRERDWLLAMFDYYDRHGFPAGSRTLEALLGRPGRSLAGTLRRELAAGAG